MTPDTAPEAIIQALLRCPFCGNDGNGAIEDALHVSHIEDSEHFAYDRYTVQCDRCTATMGYSDSEDQAVEAWNTRHRRLSSHSAGEGLREAAENLVIGIGMGWDLEGLVGKVNEALTPPSDAGSTTRSGGEGVGDPAYALPLPPEWALDEAARRAGFADWFAVPAAVQTPTNRRIIVNARSIAATTSSPDASPDSGEAIPENMTPWEGGDGPPEDAGEIVGIMTRGGSFSVMRAEAVHWRSGTFIYEIGEAMPADCEVIAYVPANIARPSPSPAIVKEAGEVWNSPDLRDLHNDVERFRAHDFSGQRLRDLLQATMDTLRAADAEISNDR